jgi:hypothetical protein
MLAVLVFGNALANGFVWDDSVYVLNIETYRGFDLQRFIFGLGNGAEYLPVKDLSYAVDFAIWGMNPAGFHITNLIIYLLNVVAVYLLAEVLTVTLQTDAKVEENFSGGAIAFCTAALFALHPIHCETVNFVASRNTLLAGLFCFLATRSFVLFLGDTVNFNRKRLAASYCWYVLAVLSKASAVSLPIFFLALFVVIRRRSLALRMICTLPFFAITGAVYAAFTSIAEKSGVINPFIRSHVPVLDRIATAVQIPFFYLGKLIVPYWLSVDYRMVFTSWSVAPYAAIATITLVILALLAFAMRKKAPYVFVAFCWFTVTLLPVMQLLPSAMSVADRYVYLPSFAFCYLLAGMFCRITIWRPYAFVLVSGILLCIYGYLSFEQNKVWKSNFDLWEYTLSVSPNSSQALTNLGANYYVIGNYTKSFEYLERMRQIEPLDPAYDFFKGHYSFVRNDFPDAVRSFEMALAKKNDLIDALYYMGIICENYRNRDCAVSYYQRVLDSRDVDRTGSKNLASGRLKILGVVSVR